MTYKTHVSFALLVAVPFGVLSSVVTSGIDMLFYLGVIFGSLLPDLDEEGSYIGQKVPIFPIIYDMLGIKHRGITHQLIFVVVLLGTILIVTYINDADNLTNVLLYGLVFGYLMHLFGDMLTKGGINKFYYPLSSNKGVLLPRQLRFYTSSKEEFYIFRIITLFTFIEIIYFGMISG